MIGRLVTLILLSFAPIIAMEATLESPHFWRPLKVSPNMENSYIDNLFAPPRHANFRDVGTHAIKQTPYYGCKGLDKNATTWSSDLQIADFFRQNKIAFKKKHFNF